jgi:hypothetical protein
MNERFCSISILMSSNNPSASGASATAFASSAKPGDVVPCQIIDVRARLGMFTNQPAEPPSLTKTEYAIEFLHQSDKAEIGATSLQGGHLGKSPG